LGGCLHIISYVVIYKLQSVMDVCIVTCVTERMNKKQTHTHTHTYIQTHTHMCTYVHDPKKFWKNCKYAKYRSLV